MCHSKKGFGKQLHTDAWPASLHNYLDSIHLIDHPLSQKIGVTTYAEIGSNTYAKRAKFQYITLAIFA